MCKKFFVLFTSIILILSIFASAENFNFVYDDNGNILEGIFNSYEYDSFNQLTKVYDSNDNILEEYTYDHEGNRVKKVEHLINGGTRKTYYLNDNVVRVIDSSGTSDTIYVYDDQGTLLAREDSDGEMFYYHPDHLGSTTLITNENGRVFEESSYLPFGDVLEGGSDRYTFTGQESDSTGLMYYGARYYSPTLRQFTQPDTIIQDYYNPQNLNRYSYVLNNPYKYTDPSGNIVCGGICLGIGVGLTYLAAVTVPYWGQAFQALTAYDFVESTNNFVEKPSLGNLFWAGLAWEDAISPGIPESAIIKKIPINKLWGHETTNAARLFRKGAKTHLDEPIEVIRIGDEYLIDNGVGKSMRALKEGESFVNANVALDRSYKSVDHLKSLADEGYQSAKEDLRWWERSTKIVDSRRWDNLK